MSALRRLVVVIIIVIVLLVSPPTVPSSLTSRLLSLRVTIFRLLCISLVVLVVIAATSSVAVVTMVVGVVGVLRVIATMIVASSTAFHFIVENQKYLIKNVHYSYA